MEFKLCTLGFPELNILANAEGWQVDNHKVRGGYAFREWWINIG